MNLGLRVMNEFIFILLFKFKIFLTYFSLLLLDYMQFSKSLFSFVLLNKSLEQKLNKFLI